MQRTKSKLLSILLSLVMLLSLLPTTALAAGKPDPTFVSVDGGKGFASPTKLYYKNGDTEDHFTGSSTDYNAAYDPATGTLTLNDYDGGRISLGGAAAYDLTIKLIGHNTVTVNDGYGDVGIDTNGSGSNITITADSSGSTLTIDLTANDKTVAGINNHLVGSVTSGNVTIKGYADVTINATTKATNKTCYGIYADDVVIEDDAKLAITVNAPNSKGGPIYGIFAKSDVTINTDGVITVDATNAGTTDRVYSTGINARNSLTLTKVGGMTVKWKDKDFGAPLSPSTASFNPAEYDTNVDTTNCIATYMPKVATPTATVADVTIDGEKDSPITNKDVVITLTNDEFNAITADADVKGWFTNLPAGLEAKIKNDVSANATTATVEISGTPTATSSAELAITIPAANLVSNTALTVTNNPSAKFAITAPATPIAVPAANTGLVYDGTEKTGVSESAGYTLTGTYKATDVGTADYTATATLNPGYTWTGGSTGDKTITWNIGKRTPTATDFTFAPPTDLTYDGSNKTASVTLNSPFTKSGAITPTYMKGSSVVTETKDVGTYTVKIDVAGGDNFNAGSNLTASTWTFSITPANQSAPTGLGVAAPIASGGNGKITGTTDKMEYNTDAAATSGWTACFATETEVAPGTTYYVRFKADSNHNAGAAAAVTVPAYSATKYTVTVTSDANGTAGADKTANVAAGETVTLTATPNSGYVFDKWVDKTPTSLTIGAGGTFTMPSENVSVKATFKPAALTGMASITGTLKYGAELTATLTGGNNTGTLTYKWYRGSDEIIGATGSTYTLVEEDIGKAITVKITSNVQTGEITSSATGNIEKADGPEAPTAFTLSFTPNADGTTFTATIPTVAGGEYSFDGTNYSATNTKADCAANSSYTGYVRIAETSTHKASTATSSTQTSPKLTVATPTFMPNGVSGFTGTQSVKISCATAGATIHYTTNGTAPTASSPVYSTPLSLTSTTTVKAIAVMTDMNDSAIATATFNKYSGGGGGGGGSYTPSYTVSVDKTENGTITVSPKSASKGDTVTITVKPDKGYELDTLKVLDKNGDKVKLTEKNGKYTFTMPTGKVTVKGSFVEEAPVQIFKDVPVDAYYYEAVKWAAEKGITGGVGNGLFAPNQPCTRAQIVTFLWRAAGSPEPKTMSSFVDVPADAFYAKAVAWAVENGITGGTGDGKFSPDATCTRAQSVTFLYRAAGSPKVSGSAEFGDVATNAYYADAVAWAAKNGITGGIGGGLFGSGNDCTRGQIVTFLYRAYNK